MCTNMRILVKEYGERHLRLYCIRLWRAGKMGKETTFIAVALGGVASAVSVYSLQRYYAPHFDKKGDKLSSPGFSFLPKYAYLPSRC